MKPSKQILQITLILVVVSVTAVLGKNVMSADSVFSETDSLQKTLIKAAQINRLPQRGVDALLEIQPAIIVQNGGLHILGGRDDETGFYLNGLPIIDPFTNTRFMHIIPEAIEQIDIHTSGYSVGFGGANSGLVNTRLKTGKSRHHFSVDYQTDKFSAAGKKFLNTYSYRDQIISATAGGPLYLPGLNYFMALENEQIGDTQKRFSKGFTIDSLFSLPHLYPDSLDRLTYIDGFTPNNSSKRWAGNATILFAGKNIRSQLNVLFDRQKLYEDNQPMLHILNDRHQYLVNQNWFVSGHFEHQLPKYLRYSVDAGMSRKHSERYDDYFGNDWHKWSDSLAVARHTNGRIQYRNGWRPQYDYYLNGFSFERDGTLNNPYYFKQEQKAIFGRFDLQALFGDHHFQFGADARSYILRNFEINTIFMNSYLSRFGSEELIPEFYGGDLPKPHNYGYDRFGHEIQYGLDGPREPLFVSAYFEDRIQHKDAVFTFGLRYDYFNTDDRVLINPGNPSVNEQEAKIKEDAWKDKKPTRVLQPRFGVTLFINSGSQLYFTYGKYVQPPKSSLYYFNSSEYGHQIVDAGNLYYEPIGFNLDPIYTTVGKLGFRKEFLKGLSLNLNLFYKTSRNLPQTVKTPADPYASIQTYYSIQTADYSKNMGINLSVVTKRKKRLQVLFDYTFQHATGTGSYPASHLITVFRNINRPINEHPLDYAVTHKGMVDLDYRFSKDDGGSVLEQLGVNLLFRFNSGHPFTRDSIPPPG